MELLPRRSVVIDARRAGICAGQKSHDSGRIDFPFSAL
jgi:hypothetical protein